MIRESKRRKWSQIAHAIWAVLGVLVSLLLFAFGGEGHPHPVIFLPLVIVIWAVGHVAIWGAGRLAARGRRRASGTDREGQSWPMVLRFALTGTGLGASVGLLQIVVTVFNRRLYPYHGTGLWTIMLAVWLVHGVSFAGLLLRQPWSRFASMLVAFAWASMAGVQMAEQLMRGYGMDATAFLILSGSTVFLLWFGLHLATSSRVKLFLSGGSIDSVTRK